MVFRTSAWYRRVRASAAAWELINAPSRLRYLLRGSALSPAERAVAERLARDGIAITRMEQLFRPETFAELRERARSRRQHPDVARACAERLTGAVRTPGKAQFLVNLWEGEHALDWSHPYIRFSLSTPILGVVNAYLGRLAKFREFFLQVTVPVARNTSRVSSQRWHADPDDRKLVKVFLYLCDVDETAGPFTYVRSSHGGGRWRSVFGFDPQKGRHPDPGFVQRTVPPEDIIVATGGAGTLIFCDTSGIHRGGYATAKERTMYTSVYTTRASALPRRYSVPERAAPPSASLSPQARYAISTAL